MTEKHDSLNALAPWSDDDWQLDPTGARWAQALGYALPLLVLIGLLASAMGWV